LAWDNLRKTFYGKVTDGQGAKWRRNIAENFNSLSRVHERYRRQTDRRQTDGRTTTYSEHEHEFTFAKNSLSGYHVVKQHTETINIYSNITVLQRKAGNTNLTE